MRRRLALLMPFVVVGASLRFCFASRRFDFAAVFLSILLQTFTLFTVTNPL
jgi:hypothetical protein